MKRVLVVGASKGMGQAIAERCAKEGHMVMTMQRTEPDPWRPFIEFDYAAPYEVIRDKVRLAIDALGGQLDWLVLAGGQGAYMGWRDFNPMKAEELMRVNYFGPRYVFRAALRALVRRHEKLNCHLCDPFAEPRVCWQCGGSGTVRRVVGEPSRVLLLGSTVTAPPGAAALEDYAATKGALQGFFPSAVRHYTRAGIRLIELATSWVDTPMTQAIRDQNPQLYHRILKFLPLRRMATAEEAADVAHHLLSGPEFWAGCRVTFSGGAN